MPSNDSKPSMISIYSRLFRNPAAIIFFLLFMLIYSLLFVVLGSREPVNFLEIVKAAPFAFSALVVGAFSLLFWALNYVGRQQKVEMRIKEAEQLFQVRRDAIDSVFHNIRTSEDLELAVLKSHLLMSAEEVKGEPETPASAFALNYGDAVNAILRRS